MHQPGLFPAFGKVSNRILFDCCPYRSADMSVKNLAANHASADTLARLLVPIAAARSPVQSHVSHARYFKLPRFGTFTFHFSRCPVTEAVGMVSASTFAVSHVHWSLATRVVGVCCLADTSALDYVEIPVQINVEFAIQRIPLLRCSLVLKTNKEQGLYILLTVGTWFTLTRSPPG